MAAKKNKTSDLTDPPKDREKLMEEEVILNLPDVKDIPGQENIRPPRFSEFADTTASSDDEEGKGVLDDDLTDEDSGSEVTAEDRKLLDESFEDRSTEEEPVEDLALDDVDEDGDPLNEKNLEDDEFGEDLDEPLIKEEEEDSE